MQHNTPSTLMKKLSVVIYPSNHKLSSWKLRREKLGSIIWYFLSIYRQYDILKNSKLYSLNNGYMSAFNILNLIKNDIWHNV